MGKDFRYYETQSVQNTIKWLEDALYDDDMKFIKTIINNESWHGMNHTTMTKAETLNSVISKEKTANSRFIFDPENEDSIEDQMYFNMSDTLAPVVKQIAAWRFGDNTPNRLKITTVLDSNVAIGTGYVYNEDTNKVEAKKTNAISIVLQKSTSNEFGIDAITAFPELQPNIKKEMKDKTLIHKKNESQYIITNPEQIEVTSNGKIKPETIKESETYKNASERKREQLIQKCIDAGEEINKKSIPNNFQKEIEHP